MLWTSDLHARKGLLCIANVSIVHQHGSLVGVSNHSIGDLTTSAEAEPVAVPCIVKLHSTQRLVPVSQYTGQGQGRAGQGRAGQGRAGQGRLYQKSSWYSYTP